MIFYTKPYLDLPKSLKFFLTFLFVIPSLYGNAQSPYVPVTNPYVINIDSVSHAPDKPIPFDQSFTMILKPRNPQNIVKIMAYNTIVDAQGKPTIGTAVAPFFVTSPKLFGQEVAINFPARKPDFHFDFCLLRRLDSTVMDTFLTYTNFIARTRLIGAGITPAQMYAEDMRYNGFINNLENTPYTYYGTTSIQYDYLFASTCNIDMITYNNSGAPVPPAGCPARSLEQLFLVTPDLDTEYGAIIHLAVPLPPYGAGGTLENDLETAIPLLNTNKYSDVSANALLKIGVGRLNDLVTGLIALNFNYQTPSAAPEDIKQRLNNMKTVYKGLAGLQDTIERMSYELGPNPALIRLNTFLKSLVVNVNAGENTVLTNYNAIRSSFKGNPDLDYTEWYVNNTDSFADLVSESGSVVSAQIGLSFLGVHKNEGGYDVLPKITTGINFNFRSLNKNLIRRDIPDNLKGFWNYWSGYLGLTFGGFKNTEYNNLLTSNSLLVGLNYRITRSLYFSFGTSIYQQQYKNPVIDDYHTQFGGYASLQLDIDILSTVSSIYSYFTK